MRKMNSLATASCPDDQTRRVQASRPDAKNIVMDTALGHGSDGIVT